MYAAGPVIMKRKKESPRKTRLCMWLVKATSVCA